MKKENILTSSNLFAINYAILTESNKEKGFFKKIKDTIIKFISWIKNKAISLLNKIVDVFVKLKNKIFKKKDKNKLNEAEQIKYFKTKVDLRKFTRILKKIEAVIYENNKQIVENNINNNRLNKVENEINHLINFEEINAFDYKVFSETIFNSTIASIKKITKNLQIQIKVLTAYKKRIKDITNPDMIFYLEKSLSLLTNVIRYFSQVTLKLLNK